MNTAPFVMTVSKELAQKEPHLTLEFLSEVIAGFQQYSPALKQFCVAYISPWLPNLSLTLFEATATEQEKVNIHIKERIVRWYNREEGKTGIYRWMDVQLHGDDL